MPGEERQRHFCVLVILALRVDLPLLSSLAFVIKSAEGEFLFLKRFSDVMYVGEHLPTLELFLSVCGKKLLVCHCAALQP